MLQIIINNYIADIGTDTAITFVIENPMLRTDRIPIPYSLSYTLPATANNLMILGNPQRITSMVDFFAKIPTKILFSGVEIASGEQTIEQIEGNTITLCFDGTFLPENIKKRLQNQHLGVMDLGMVTLETNERRGTQQYSLVAPFTSYYQALTNNLTQKSADWVAAPVSLQDGSWADLEDTDLAMLQRECWINAYNNGYKYTDSRNANAISKILPQFRVGYILNKLLFPNIEDPQFNPSNLFDSDQWQRLYLITKYNPNYSTKDNSQVWKITPNKQVTIDYSEFMPDIEAGVFINEMLKLPCATLYTKGASYSIELNKATLARSSRYDWSDKIFDKPIISKTSGATYLYGYQGDYGTIPDEVIPLTTESIYDMHRSAMHPESELTTYMVQTTGQVFESLFDDSSTENRMKFRLLKQEMGGVSKDLENEGDTFDMMFPGEAVRTVPMPKVDRVNQLRSTFHYAPQVSSAAQRPEALEIGLYYGLKSEIKGTGTYPYFTHCNYDAFGNRLGNLTLQFQGSDGLWEKYHKEFKEWIEKPKRVIRAKVLLDAFDLRDLDLRNKVHINGVDFFIKELSVNITNRMIEPSNIEFIEG